MRASSRGVDSSASSVNSVAVVSVRKPIKIATLRIMAARAMRKFRTRVGVLFG